MMECKWFFIGVVFLAILSLTSCSPPHGRQVKEGKITIYYKKPVTRKEATRLAKFLDQGGFFKDSARITAQIGKDKGTYEFRFVVTKKEAEKTEFKEGFRAIGYHVAREIFPSEKLEIHLCDQHLKPFDKILIGAVDPIEYPKVKYGHSTLYYSDTIKEKTARKLGAYLQVSNIINADKKRIFIFEKKGDTYQLKIVLNSSDLQDGTVVQAFGSKARHIDRAVFKNFDFEIHLCNHDLETQKVLKGRKKKKKKKKKQKEKKEKESSQDEPSPPKKATDKKKE